MMATSVLLKWSCYIGYGLCSSKSDSSAMSIMIPVGDFHRQDCSEGQ